MKLPSKKWSGKADAIIFVILVATGSAGAQKIDTLLFSSGPLLIYKTKAIHNGKTIYDAAVDKQRALENDSICGGQEEVVYTPLSLAGPYYSYERTQFQYGSIECGSPADYPAIHSVDIRSGKSIRITELVEEASFVAALKMDPYVKKLAIPADSLAASETIATVLSLINQYDDTQYGKFSENEFVFTSYNPKTNQVGVQLARRNYRGFDHYGFLRLGLWITPNPDFKTKLLGNSKFFLGKFKGGILNP
jgi:hypothetical protein